MLKHPLVKELKQQCSTTLGRRRVEKELTQEEAAELCGVTPRDYQNWERGASLPSLKNAARIYREMGISVDALFDLTFKELEKEQEKAPV